MQFGEEPTQIGPISLTNDSILHNPPRLCTGGKRIKIASEIYIPMLTTLKSKLRANNRFHIGAQPPPETPKENLQ